MKRDATRKGVSKRKLHAANYKPGQSGNPDGAPLAAYDKQLDRCRKALRK